MKCIIFTNNLKKCIELEKLLNSKTINVTRYKDETNKHINVIEDGNTFQENALKKLHAINFLNSHITIADDSGLEITSLNGEPGIYSARYGGESLTDHERCQYVLNKLTQEQNRAAQFCCYIAIKLPTKEPKVFKGTCKGTITHKPSGLNGFGYDPIFIPNDYTQTFADLDSTIKNKISHRAKALNLVKTYIHSELNI